MHMYGGTFICAYVVYMYIVSISTYLKHCRYIDNDTCSLDGSGGVYMGYRYGQTVRRRKQSEKQWQPGDTKPIWKDKTTNNIGLAENTTYP